MKWIVLLLDPKNFNIVYRNVEMLSRIINQNRAKKIRIELWLSFLSIFSKISLSIRWEPLEIKQIICCNAGELYTLINL